MSVQPIGPVEGGSPGTYKIPVQKIDYVSAAWGGVCVQGEWISATMRQSMTPRIYHKRYSHTIQSRGLRIFFFLTDFWTQKVVLSWPGSPLEGQISNKRTAGLYRKVFFTKVHRSSY